MGVSANGDIHRFPHRCGYRRGCASWRVQRDVYKRQRCDRINENGARVMNCLPFLGQGNRSPRDGRLSLWGPTEDADTVSYTHLALELLLAFLYSSFLRAPGSGEFRLVLSGMRVVLCFASMPDVYKRQE